MRHRALCQQALRKLDVDHHVDRCKLPQAPAYHAVIGAEADGDGKAAPDQRKALGKFVGDAAQ
jgi:hypothetical protein